MRPCALRGLYHATHCITSSKSTKVYKSGYLVYIALREVNKVDKLLHHIAKIKQPSAINWKAVLLYDWRQLSRSQSRVEASPVMLRVTESDCVIPDYGSGKISYLPPAWKAGSGHCYHGEPD